MVRQMVKRSQMRTGYDSSMFLYLQELHESLSHQTLDHKVAFSQLRISLMDVVKFQCVAQLYQIDSKLRQYDRGVQSLWK